MMVQLIELVVMGGYIYVIGILGNGCKGSIIFFKFFFKQLCMIGLVVGSWVMQEDMIKVIE